MDVSGPEILVLLIAVVAAGTLSSLILSYRYARAKKRQASDATAGPQNKVIPLPKSASGSHAYRRWRYSGGSSFFKEIRLPRNGRLLYAAGAVLVLGFAVDWIFASPKNPSLLSQIRSVDFPDARNHVLEGPVSHYRDGDTIEVNGMAIRFAHLDCPEMNTGEGARAKWAVMQVTNNKQLYCRLSGDRTYDRWVGTCVLPDGRTVSQAMVRGGYCRWYGLPNFRSVSKDRLLGSKGTHNGG